MTPSPLSSPFFLSLGWNEFFQSSYEALRDAGHFPGRVIRQGKGHYHVQIAEDTVIEASITSKLRHSAQTSLEFPGVGDWVTMTAGLGAEKANIHRILDRKTLLKRKRSGSTQEAQLIVTNVDFVFIATSLNDDFDIPRLGRYLALAKDSGAAFALLLTKVDLCANPDDYVAQLQSEFGREFGPQRNSDSGEETGGLTIFKISSQDPRSLDPLQKYFSPGLTSVLLGSSGVGKSTLTNYLLGSQAQKTQGLSNEVRGQHTTTSRTLFATRWGGLVIDTPGMQEVAAAVTTDEAPDLFPDIQELMLRCKFTNCRHGHDPGCAISAGIKKGTLLTERWDAFTKSKNRG